MKSIFENKSENKKRSENNTTNNVLEYATDCEKEFRYYNGANQFTIYGKF